MHEIKFQLHPDIGKRAKGNVTTYINKIIKYHGYFYNYDKVVFRTCGEKITITCPIHGDFDMSVESHKLGHGCRSCGYAKNSLGATLTWPTVLSRMVAKHGSRYDYSNAEDAYNGTHSHISIICHNHPTPHRFNQTPKSHIAGQGCPLCYGNAKKSITDVLSDFTKRHGDLFVYDINKITECYKGPHKLIPVTCRIHGEFHITPNSHRLGTGCRECQYDGMARYRPSTTDEFIMEARKVHGDRFGYDKTIFKSLNMHKIEIYCKVHGCFLQTPSQHLTGHICNDCAIANGRMSTEDFIDASREKFGTKFAYHQVVCRGLDSEIIVECLIHGDITTTPTKHLHSKHGCSLCFSDTRGMSIRLDPSEYFDRARLAHCFKYSYDLTSFTKTANTIRLYCHDCMEFSSVPANTHLYNKTGCPNCYHITDNDTIYLLKAIGLADTYKIGVTSKRLNDSRIDKLEAASGLTFETIRLAPTKCRATELETKLLQIGERPFMDKFAGYTEFRVLREHELKWVVDAIDQYTL